MKTNSRENALQKKLAKEREEARRKAKKGEDVSVDDDKWWTWLMSSGKKRGKK